MAYKIKSFSGKYNREGKLEKVEVKVDYDSHVRTYFATNKPCAGYCWLRPDAKLNEELLQEVAGYGMRK